jgi:FlaA1/EpsC-like NDP-sugar epimerase
MRIPEAVQSILQAGAMDEGGDVFVLDMGKPMRIAYLARHMIRLARRTVRDASAADGDVEIVFTGLRSGEKMFEELVIGAELRPTAHPAVMVAVEGFEPRGSLEARLQRLEAAVSQHDGGGVRRLISADQAVRASRGSASSAGE